MIKATDVNTTNVTDEQIGKCHKIFEGSIPAYMVESESDNLTEYKVRWSKKHGFTCTCEAGQHGFSKCRDGICKHVKWSVACSREEKAAVAELNRLIAEQAPVAAYTTDQDAATVARVQAACEGPVKVSKAKANSPRGFSLLKI